METTTDIMPWSICAAIGINLVLLGAPIYSNARTLPLLAGWAGIIAAWYLILETLRDLTLIEILSWLGSILGAILAIAVFSICQIYRAKLPLNESTPLTEKEKICSSVISRHLEASDEF